VTRKKVSPTPLTPLGRAAIRRSLLTVLPDRLSRGRLSRAHLAQPIVLRSVPVFLPGAPDALHGLRIAHLSDFHVGGLIPVERALEAIELAQVEQPDLVACTGDVVDLELAGCEPVFKALGRMKSRLGTLMVMGNHDHLEHAESVARLARRSGIRLLQDEVARLPSGPMVAGLDWTVGVRDAQKRLKAMLDGREELPPILLAHHPAAFRAAAQHGIPLTLSGHTHGLQVGLTRGTGDQSRPAKGRSLHDGLYHLGASSVFVTRGVGSWFPLRVNRPAEVAILDVRVR
jgi:predicted MPP superfamily phosphohydrolase